MAATSSFDKNPLTIAFGLALKKARSLSEKDSSTIAKEIEIGNTYYRLVEAGTNNLAVSKSLNLIMAFDKFSYQGVVTLLSAISIMQVKAKKAEEENIGYGNGLHLVASQLCNTDDKKLEMLINRFMEVDIFRKVDKFKGNPDKISALVVENKLDTFVYDFLTNYEQYELTTSDKIIKKETIITNISYELPTIYYDYVESFIKETKKLPVRINFEDLHNWEDELQNEFISIHAIVRNHNLVTHEENLKKYLYNYLWGKKFQNAYFIFIEEDKSPKELKKIFIDNLYKSLKNKKPDRLKDFDVKMNKVKFKTCKKEFDIAKLLLTETTKDNNKINYDAAWCFALAEDKLIGFVAKAKQSEKFPDYEIFDDGKSLNYSNTKNMLNVLQNFWEDNNEQ